MHFVDLEIFDDKEELNGRIWSLEVLLMKIEGMSFGGWIERAKEDEDLKCLKSIDEVLQVMKSAREFKYRDDRSEQEKKKRVA